MNQKICFDSNLFIFGIIAFSMIIYLNNNLNKKQNNERFNEVKKLRSRNDIDNSCNNVVEDDKFKNHSSNTLISAKYYKPSIYKPLIDKLIDRRDTDAVNDPLKPPNRRLPRHIYPDHVKDFIFEQPTRGYPDNYHYYGNLIRREDNKIVKLYGRQMYPGSNQYEYYGITSDGVGSAEVKIPVNTKNNKELYDKDKIDIDFLDSTKGEFILYMNDFDRPRYNPFVIN